MQLPMLSGCTDGMLEIHVDHFAVRRARYDSIKIQRILLQIPLEEKTLTPEIANKFSLEWVTELDFGKLNQNHKLKGLPFLKISIKLTSVNQLNGLKVYHWQESKLSTWKPSLTNVFNQISSTCIKTPISTTSSSVN